MKKRIISLILALCMVVTMLPTVAFAGGTITATGYTYDPDTNTLTITSDAATTAWRVDSNITKADVTTVVIKEGVDTIGAQAFSDCTNLASVTIPESVTSIGNTAFDSCTDLKSVTFEGATPPTFGSNVFVNTARTLKIYVPSAGVDNYKAKLAPYASIISPLWDSTTITAESKVFPGDGVKFSTALPGSHCSLDYLKIDSTEVGVSKKLSGALDTDKIVQIDTFEDITGENGLLGTVPPGKKFSHWQPTDTTVTHPEDELQVLQLKAVFVEDVAPSTKITTTLNLRGVTVDVKCTDSDVGTIVTGMTQHTHADSKPCWAWENATQKLTLNNVDIDVSSGGGSGYGIVLPQAATTVKFSGSNTVKATVYGIYHDRNSLTLTGESNSASLTISANQEQGIFFDNSLTITKGIVNVTSESHLAIDSDSVSYSINLSGGTVTAKGANGYSPFGVGPTLLNGMAHKAGTGTWNNTAGTACVYEKGTAVTGVTLNKSTISLYSNTNQRSETLTATVAPSNATNKAVTWSSSNPAVATVANGTVTAVANGTATITATTTDGNFTASCTVTVSTYSSGGDDDSSTATGSSTEIIVTPPQAATPDAPTEVILKLAGQVDSDGKANVTVNNGDIANAIKKAEDAAKKNGNTDNGISIVLQVSTGGRTVNSVNVNLPKSVQERIIGAKIINTIVVVNNPDIQINMDLNTVTEINKQARADVNVTASRSADKLTGEAKQFIGPRPVFDLKVQYSGKLVESFGSGNVTVSIPYTLGANEKAANVRGVYVDGSGAVQWLAGSVYDSTAKVLRFTTKHFSSYGVAYQQNDPSFGDITSHWAKADIEYVVRSGLFNGTDAGTFSPDANITRGMFVTALGRLANVDISSHKQSSFSDVGANAYYMGYVEWAKSLGIVRGFDGKFMPDQAITREQMAVILAGYVKANNMVLPQTLAEIHFADEASISGYAKDAVVLMQRAGLFNGKGENRFDPQSVASRAEAATLLHRFAALLNK